MDKEKVKETLGEAAAKAKVALSEIKANFKADEGTTGFPKVKSMFVNLWKSGTTGRVALIASSVIVLLLLVSLFGGGGEPGTSFASKSKRKVPKDMLAVKGLYMRMPGDDAVEACKELVASYGDLMVVDFRKGIDYEKAEKEKIYKLAEADVDRFLQWYNSGDHYDPSAPGFKGKEFEGGLFVKSARSAPLEILLDSFSLSRVGLASLYDYQIEWMHPGKRESDGKIEEVSAVVEIPSDIRERVKKREMHSEADIEDFLKNLCCKIIEKEQGKDSLLGDLCKKRGLVEVDTSRDPKSGSMLHPWMRVWFRLALRKTNGDTVTKEEVVRNWLAAQGRLMKVAPKNLIQISIKQNGVREDELKGLCFVWVDDQNKVKEIRFNEVGMARLFNAGDLSGEEFAQALVNNYSIIPSLKPNVEEESMLAENGESIHVKTSTWIHKDPKGYQVKIFERTAYYKNGIMKYDAKNADSTSPLTYALALAGKTPMKYFTIFATKPESSRKFD